jgi:hypothetical protein
MNTDLMQVFKDFRLLTKDVKSSKDANEILSNEFNMDIPEIVDLWLVFKELIMEKYNLKKLSKKQAEQLDSFIAMLFDSYFFGMYVSKHYIK